MGDVLLDVSVPGGIASYVAIIASVITAILEGVRRAKKRDERAMQSIPETLPAGQPTPADILARLHRMESEAALSRARWQVDELQKAFDEVSADGARTAAALSAERKLREQLEESLRIERQARKQLRAKLADRDALIAERDARIARLERELAAADARAVQIAEEAGLKKHEEGSTFSTTPDRAVTPLLPAARRRPKGNPP